MTPLRIHPENPRYFQDDQDRAGRAVWLAGSHHWDVLLDNSERAERPGGFDFEGYLDRLEAWGHNFVRLWTHEAWTREILPPRYLRVGSRYDLTRFDPEHFGRLRSRVSRAGERGFYVGVMLFNGWSIHDNGEGNPWVHHPFNGLSNVNGIDGDPDARGDGLDVHTLRIPAITRLQEAWVDRVIETVGDRDHVLWEISNESPGESRDWQIHFIRYLKARSPLPVGMTSCFPRGRNRDLFDSPADWVSPNRRGGYQRNPPPSDGRKAVLLDTDHLWGIGGDRRWVWKSFLAGCHVLYMDPLDDDPVREEARRAMGAARRLAERIDLAGMLPSPARASTGHCLAGAREMLVYLPRGRGRVDLTGFPGEVEAEWIDPLDGAVAGMERLVGGKVRKVKNPGQGDAVLLLRGLPPPPAPPGHTPPA